MQLQANTHIGKMVYWLLFARYEERHPDERLVATSFDHLFDLMFTMRSRALNMFSGVEIENMMCLIAIRAMVRGNDIEHTPLTKATSTLKDVRTFLRISNLAPILEEEDAEIQATLIDLYGCQPGQGRLGVLGHTLLSICTYYLRLLPRASNAERARLARSFRQLALAADRASTLAEQRGAINELAQSLHSAVRRRIPEAASGVSQSLWEFTTGYLTHNPRLWRVPGLEG